MIDLITIKSENAERKRMRAPITPGPWTIYQGIWRKADREFVAYARDDNADEVIDALVAEVEELRVISGLPLFPGFDKMEEGQTYLMTMKYTGKATPRVMVDEARP